MGNKTKKTQRTAQIERTILSLIADLSPLVDTHPELFNFGSLDFHQKLELIRCDIKYKFLIEKLNSSEKCIILSDKSLYKIHKDIELTENELNSLNDSSYLSLLQSQSQSQSQFDKYIRKEKFLKLGKKAKADVFVENPDWYIKEISSTETPKLTSTVLNSLAYNKPEFIDSYITDYSSLSTTSRFWLKMIDYNSKYRKIFVENTNSLLNKSEVRYVFNIDPTLIKLIDESVINSMKLSAKEILLMMDQIIKDNNKMFKDWEINDKLKESLRLDVTVELLNGKSKLSKRLQSSLKAVTEQKEDEDETEVAV